ncbi:MAG: BON domain-containing protein [Spirochaetota bacterium]
MKTKYSIFLILAVVAVLLFSMPVLALNMDERIELSIKNSFVFKTYLKDDDIKIQSRNGAVTLTGIVSGEYHKLLAQETMDGLAGIKSVDNRLEVKDALPTRNSDAWLRDRVKVMLLLHRSISADKTEVDVKDGVVYLRGYTANLAQKELTAEYTRDVEGVKDVINEMTVSKTPEKTIRTTGEKIDDASITAQIKIALLLHRSTSVLNTTVSTKRGIVTVGGKARNAAEKDMVTKIVNDINGVKSVNNKMIVG